MTLAEKAQFYEDEIDKYHRRTPYEYVRWVNLDKPGDKSVWHNATVTTTANGPESTARPNVSAMRPPRTRRPRSAPTTAFEALRFLSQVTQGGSHPVPKGFPARTILPTDGPRNPNKEKSYSIEADEEERANSDGLWKILHPRWPIERGWKMVLEMRHEFRRTRRALLPLRLLL